MQKIYTQKRNSSKTLKIVIKSKRTNEEGKKTYKNKSKTIDKMAIKYQ